MYEFLIAPFFDFQFMRRALVGCLALSLAATPMGLFMLLRRMSLMADAMSHAILPGAALGYLFFGLSLGAMSIGGIFAGLLVALASGFVARASVLREDASLAAFYLFSLAAGVLIISVRGRNIDLLHVLFGNVLALDTNSLLFIVGVSILTFFALALLFRPLVAECHDPAFFKTVSRASAVAHYSFLVLVTLNLVGGFHALGTLMVVGIMLLPTASARLCCRRLSAMLVLSVVFAFASSFCGLLLSFHYDFPAGPAIIVVASHVYFGALLLGRGGILRASWQRYFPPRHLES